MFTAATILSIPSDAPERLFHGPAEAVARQYRSLAMRWHPDRPENQGCIEAGEVFRKIAALKELADAQIASRSWYPAPGRAEFTTNDGRNFSFDYRAHRRFDLGHVLIGTDRVAYLVQPEFSDLYDRARSTIAGVAFADDKMRTEFEVQLPRLERVVDTTDFRILVLHKDIEAVLLSDLLARVGGQMPAAHVAWLISRSLNLACWLGWAKRFHGDISATSLFVNPRLHSASLLGGWWFSTPVGEPLTALPARSATLMPSDVLHRKVGDARGDLELIRALGRELLGDAAGSGLSRNACIPAALTAWVLQAGGPSAFHDFESWPSVLKNAFGPRRFVELPVRFDDVYPPHPV